LAHSSPEEKTSIVESCARLGIQDGHRKSSRRRSGASLKVCNVGRSAHAVTIAQHTVPADYEVLDRFNGEQLEFPKAFWLMRFRLISILLLSNFAPVPLLAGAFHCGGAALVKFVDSTPIEASRSSYPHGPFDSR
jgi:hypothetical protein